MRVRLIQKAVLYIKEIQDVGLFALMSDSRIFAIFNGTPLFYVMLPFIGLLLTVLAIINGYRLAKASNKNFDQWFGFIISALCAVMASVSLYGSVISTAYGLSFIAGPWFFLASIVTVSFHQMVMLGLNGYRAYESLNGSAQRMHYIQACLNNLFTLGLLAAVIGAVVFVMLLPIAPAVGSGFALTAVALTLLNVGWRILPANWKQFIKGLLFLGKPESVPQDETIKSPELKDIVETGLNKEDKYHRIFTCYDYNAEVKNMDLNSGEAYLRSIISRKVALLYDQTLPQTDHNNQKAAFLSDVLSSLTHHTAMRKSDLLLKYPAAFQSFWSEKNDVEQIYDAAKVLISRYEMEKGFGSILAEPEHNTLLSI